MADINSLISGFRIFKATEHAKFKDMIEHVIKLNIKPKTIVICCSDMRMSPGRIFSANPGDIYVIRNAGALVPPFGSEQVNGVEASIEYAVNNLEVDNIVVLGHAYCDALKFYFRMDESKVKKDDNIYKWLSLGKEAKNAVINNMQDRNDDDQEFAHVQESIIVSLKNLLSYPTLREKVDSYKVKLYGWMINLKDGQLITFNPQTKRFEQIE